MQRDGHKAFQYRFLKVNPGQKMSQQFNKVVIGLGKEKA